MSSYGCHKQQEWTGSLRSPRNPMPPRTPGREAAYVQEPSPPWKASDLATVLRMTPRVPRSARPKSAHEVSHAYKAHQAGVPNVKRAMDDIHIPTRDRNAASDRASMSFVEALGTMGSIGKPLPSKPD